MGELIGEPGLAPRTAGKTDLVGRAIHGAAALVARQALVYGSNILGGITLARLLSPAEFGFYGVVLFFVNFLNIFGGTGFASNLIRTDQEADLNDYRAIFSAQQVFIAVLFAGMWIAAPRIGGFYHLNHGSTFFRLISVALVLTSLMVIPQIQMERELAFNKLAVTEAAQAVIFNGSAVLLAWRGFGVLSFAIALTARAATGAVLCNWIEPWRAAWRWDRGALRRHLHFGLALQAGQLVSMVKDSITPVFVGLYLGAGAMGYVTWAGTLAYYPMLVQMSLQRLYMPFFARLQSDQREFARYVSHALWMTNAIAAPMTMITIGLARPITVLVFGAKWLPALPLFYCFSAGILFSVSSTPLIGALNAMGKSNLTLLMTVIWMAATWLFGVPLMMRFGLIGFGVAMILVQLTNLALYWLVWKKLRVSPWPALWPSWPVAVALSLPLILIQRYRTIRTLPMLIALAAVTGTGYVAILWFGFPRHTRAWARILRRRDGTSVAGLRGEGAL